MTRARQYEGRRIKLTLKGVQVRILPPAPWSWATLAKLNADKEAGSIAAASTSYLVLPEFAGLGL